MTTTTIREQADQLLDRLGNARSVLDELEGINDPTTSSTPSSSFPTWVIAFVAASVGFGLGTAAVALM